jgi:hypothetical protein
MTETWIFIAVGGIFALLLGRSAIIAIWPDSEAARFCGFHLGFLDHTDSSDGDGDGDGVATGAATRLIRRPLSRRPASPRPGASGSVPARTGNPRNAAA